MTTNYTPVNTHYEVEEGDILIYLNRQGQPMEVYKVTDSNWFGAMAHFFQTEFTNKVRTVVKLARYESPLRQRVIRTITVN